jgi:hypothetical protein
MSGFIQKNRYRGLGTGLLACLLLLFATNPCLAMVRIDVTKSPYSANGGDGLDDSAAFQKALDDLYASDPRGGHLYIPNGTYDFNTQVYINPTRAWDLEIQGQSRTGVVLRCNNTNGVFMLDNEKSARAGLHTTLRDVTFLANVAGAGTAYASIVPTGGTPAERMQQVFNVDVTYANTNCYFDNGINIFGANRPLVDGVTINSPTNSDMSDSSINFRMQKAINLDGSYNSVVRNTVINGAETAISVAMPYPVETEGGTCMNVAVSCVKTGFVYSIVSTTRAIVEIGGCDITARDVGISFEHRDLVVIAESTFRQLSPAYPLVDIRLANGSPIDTIVRNTFAGTLAGGRKNITIDSNCYDIVIGQNTLSGPVADAITVNSAATDVYITGNNNVTGPAFITNSFTKAGATAGYAYSGSLTNTASDPDGNVLTFSKDSGPSWLTMNFDGTLSGIPGAGDVGTNVFTVGAWDEGSLSAAATMTITVAPQSSAPLVWPGSATFVSIAAEDGVVSESAQGSGIGGDANSTTSGSGGMRLGDHATNIQYKTFVSFDTSVLPYDATVTSATLKICRSVISGDNPFLWAGPCLVDIKGGSGFSGSTVLSAGDFQAAADATNVATMSYPAANNDWSTGALSSNGLQYVSLTGTTQLRVYMSTPTDNNNTNGFMGFWSSDSATNWPVFEVGYMLPNHVPIWSSSTLTSADAIEASAYSGSVATNATDSDTGDRLTFMKVSGPTWLTVTTNGTLSGTPHNSNVGTNTFVVRAMDLYGAAADATLNITVININDAPAADNQSVTVDGDADASLVLTGTDTDSAKLTYSILANPTHGTLSGLNTNSGAVIYTPGLYFYGPDSFTFQVCDGSLYSTGTVSLTVTASVTANTGTPYWWLAQYGLTNFNDDAMADADHDGLLTWQEYVAGTNPTNPASVFEITGSSVNAQGAVIRWASASNRFYNLSRTTNLMSGFSVLAGASNLPATPPENVYTNPASAGAAVFYKINVYQ